MTHVLNRQARLPQLGSAQDFTCQCMPYFDAFKQTLLSTSKPELDPPILSVTGGRGYGRNCLLSCDSAAPSYEEECLVLSMASSITPRGARIWAARVNLCYYKSAIARFESSMEICQSRCTFLSAATTWCHGGTGQSYEYQRYQDSVIHPQCHSG